VDARHPDVAGTSPALMSKPKNVGEKRPAGKAAEKGAHRFMQEAEFLHHYRPLADRWPGYAIRNEHHDCWRSGMKRLQRSR